MSKTTGIIVLLRRFRSLTSSLTCDWGAAEDDLKMGCENVNLFLREPLGSRSENARSLIVYLYERPAVTVRQVMELLDIQFNPASNLITSLIDMGILKEITGQRRNRVFLFEPYFKIFANNESEI